MKKALSFITAMMCFSALMNAQNDIATARAQNDGDIVTISGIVTSGSEFGTIRYVQDATGGIAIYDWNYDDQMQRGDSITVTGELDDYNELWEIKSLSSFTKHASGCSLPAPQVITPDQFSDDYEGEIVQINEAVFSNAGGSFGGSTENFTSGGETGVVYVNSGNELDGEMIPFGSITLVGILSQYSYSGPDEGYQLLPRDTNDFITPLLYITSSPVQSNISQSGFDLTWTTNDSATTEYIYGNTPALELGYVQESASPDVNHTISITGASPAELFYIQPYSVKGSDTAFATIGVYITQSASSGKMRAYFNHAADTTIATGPIAQHLDYTFDDTIIAYINKAKYTIDITGYNINHLGIIDSCNAAYDRGVKVRYIACGSTNNSSLSSLNPAIDYIERPDLSNGLMHDKFIVIDAESADSAWVMSGSCNFTTDDMFHHYNNIIFIQDQSLAKAYTLEFEEMWGDTGLTANLSNAKFGADKTDNTPHNFIIGGKQVELYFSPSDQTTNQIKAAIESADFEFDFATFSFTRNDLGAAVEDADGRGVTVRGIIENINDIGCEFEDFQNAGLDVYSALIYPDFMHHKYCIVDANHTESDPLVVTGSHNWSTAAETKNDENTLIIHDSVMANIYLQEFRQRYMELTGFSPEVEAYDDTKTAYENQTTNMNVLANDLNPNLDPLTVTIIDNPNHGTANVKTDQTIDYTPDSNYTGNDTLIYQVADSVSMDTATVAITVVTGIEEIKFMNSINIYPNPAENSIRINWTENQYQKAEIMLFDLRGQKFYQKEVMRNESIDLMEMTPGLYFVELNFNNDILYISKILKN